MSLRYFLKTLPLLLLFLLPLSVEGMHIIGGEVTYECLGDGIAPGTRRYRFTMKIYRDCFGGGALFDNPANMAIYRGTYQTNSLYEQFQIFNPQITRIPPDTPACVSNIPNVCVERAIYSFERELPISTTDSYFVVYQRCCRNVTISNILTPGDIGATYFVELNPQAQAVCNNSPVFTNFPPIIICNNLALEFDHSATDADGDQLVYSMCSPFNGGGPILSPPAALVSCIGAAPNPPCAPPFQNVPFILPNYSPAFPMGGNPPIAVNSTTGLLAGTPIMQGQFVVGVCVREFRNGQLLSEVRRDFQFNVADCSPTVLASIATDSIPGPKEFIVTSCGNKVITFFNQSIQQQFIDEFEWRFNLKDTIFVDKSNWNTTVAFPDTGLYFGQLLLNPGQQCGDTAQIIALIYPEVNADFAYDYDTCVAGPVDFIDLSTGDGIIEQWDWRFGLPGAASTEQNPQFQYPVPGNHPVRLRVTDRNKCRDEVIKTINWFPAPATVIVQPSTFLGCVPANITFKNFSNPLDSNYRIVWDFGTGDILDSNIISPTYNYTEPGLYTISLSITSPIGCFVTDTFFNLIRTEPSPTAAFSYDPDTLLSTFNNTVDFIDESSGANRWLWQFGPYGTTNEQNPTFTFPDTGSVKVNLIVTHPRGCKDSTFAILDFVPEIYWHMPNAFTPNGDGANEQFFGKGFLEGATGFNMTIWNRWGELIFQTSNPDIGWDGTDAKSGTPAPEGVYVYLVTFTEPRGQKREFRGFATLIR